MYIRYHHVTPQWAAASTLLYQLAYCNNSSVSTNVNRTIITVFMLTTYKSF